MEKQPVVVSQAITIRAVLRMLPFFCHSSTVNSDDPEIQISLLATLRCLHASTVAFYRPSPDLNSALDAARDVIQAHKPRIAVFPDEALAYTITTEGQSSTAYYGSNAVSADFLYPDDFSIVAGDCVAEDIRYIVDHGSGADLMLRRLWPIEPEKLVSERLKFFNVTLRSDSRYEFWVRWHDKAMHSRPINWDEQRDIALIGHEDWAKGPSHIAELIRKIEEHHHSHIHHSNVRNRSEELLRRPISTSSALQVLARSIEISTHHYMREASANELPDELNELEQIPIILLKICSALTGDYEYEMRVSNTDDAIKELNASLAKLSSELEMLKNKSAAGQLKSSMIEQFGKSLGDWKMWGAVIAATHLTLGESLIGNQIESIAEYVRDIWGSVSKER